MLCVVGCDDAIALLFALRDPAIEVLAITSVFGNVPQSQATENVYTILRVFDRLDIPFYAGAAQPLVVDLKIETWSGHGANGLGDASFHEGADHHDHHAYIKKVNAAMGKEHAVQAMIELSNKYPGEIDLIALGPLTNFALGVRMDPLFASRFRSLTIMGGSSKGKGNASMCSEFNWYCDPEGAHVTLNHFPSPTLPVTIVPWETTEESFLTWEQFDQLCVGHEEHLSSDPNTRHRLEASFLKKTHAKYEFVVRANGKSQSQPPSKADSAPKRAKSNSGAAHPHPSDGVEERTVTADQAAAFDELPSLPDLRAAASSSTAVGAPTPQIPVGSGVPTHMAEETPSGHYVCCDAYAVAAFLRPDIITSSVRHYCRVLIHGDSESRGCLAIDWYDRKKDGLEEKKVTIVTGIDQTKFFNMMADIFQPHAHTEENTIKPGTRKRTHHK